MSYVRTLTICLLLVYFVSAAGCHCFDLPEFIKPSSASAMHAYTIGYADHALFGQKCLTH